MKNKNQLTLFDVFDARFYNSDFIDFDKKPYDIEKFDLEFGVGSRFINGTSVLEIVDLCPHDLNCWVINVTLEAKGFYVGQTYCMNKESYGRFYYSI